MNQDEKIEVRKSLLSLYADNSLQFAGFGLASIIAFVTELTGHEALDSLKFLGVPLFLPILLATVVFVMSMFFRSAFWGRMTFYTVMDQHPETPEDEADLMESMYVFHIELARQGTPLVTWIGNSALWWTVLSMAVVFAVTLVIL